MRRVRGFAVIAAAVFALAACLGGGPSDGDVDAVQEALETLGPEWSVTWVTNTSSDSEGFDHYLSIGLNRDAAIETRDVVEVFEALTAALPDDFRWRVRLSFAEGADDTFPDLIATANELGLDPGYETFYESGDIWVTVKDMNSAVAEYGS